MSANFDQARAALPLRRLLQTYGYAVPPDKTSGFTCPFCQKKGSASLRGKNGREWFKCFNTSCPSATSAPKSAWDEVRFMAWKHGLSNSDGGERRYSSAQIQYLKEAGVWREAEPARTVIGSKRRKPSVPTPPVDPSNLPPKSDALPIAPTDLIEPEGEFEPETQGDEAMAAAEAPAETAAVSPTPPPVVSDTAPLPSNVVPLHPPVDGALAGTPLGTPPPTPPPPPKPTPIQRFYDQLVLTGEDRAELRTKRGFSDAEIDRAGFRTNQRSNREILERLADEYEVVDLVRAGLWKRGDKRDHESRLRPTGQFYGWGVVAKKEKAPEAEDGEDHEDINTDAFEWAQKESGRCNPILIPYFDAAGKVMALRPHKGFPKGQKPRLYVARTVEGARAVITEGEFKSRALADVLPNWSAAAVPGITQCKNFHVWGDIGEWVMRANIKEIVIAYDNEEKGDPKLPGYKPTLEKRFEADVWARVLAERLEKLGVRTTIAKLPDAWRENGKADWDSALARLRRLHPEDPKPIAKEFEAVLDAAMRSWEFKQMKMFESDVEHVIADRAANFSYEPGLPAGGKPEKRIAKELRALAGKLRSAWDQDGSPLKISGRLMALAEEYEKTWGWYYTFKIPAMTKEKLEAQKMRCDGADQLNALNLLIKGTPHLIAPFRLMPYYVLLKPDGTRERLVRLVNTKNEDSGLVALPSHDLTAPRDWRKWLANRGNYGWEGGERELQTLQRDVNFKLARREVRQLVYHGCDMPGALWFFDDVALDDGVEVVPDDEGIFWHKRVGYTYLRNGEGIPIGEENQVFRVVTRPEGLPKMHPGKGIRQDGDKYTLVKGDDDPAALANLAGQLAVNLQQSFAAWDGLMLLGAFISFAASPEIYRSRGEFPGIWVAGEKGTGKTVSAKVCMALYGFSHLDQPMSFKSSTTVNAILTLGQLANIPDWGDEYKEGQIKEEAIKNIIHCGFNREIPGKWSPDGTTRKIRTNFIVTGESTCNNAATMDRFLSVSAAKENWKGDIDTRDARFKWLLENRKHFFVITRAILRRRKAFVETVLAELAAWERLPELATAEPRGKFAHGVAYATLCGLARIIPFMATAEVEALKDWFIKRTLGASKEVQQQVNVNQFWTDLISAQKAGAFGEGVGDLKKIFKVMERPQSGMEKLLTPEQIRMGAEDSRFIWKSYYLYFQPGPVLDQMRIHMRKGGRTLALDQSDLRAQMASRAYWVKSPDYGEGLHKQRFSGKSAENCWCINVDKMPDLGFVPVTDDQFERSKYKDGDIERGNYLSIDDEWMDPRKGDLFYLIDLLLRKPKEGSGE